MLAAPAKTRSISPPASVKRRFFESDLLSMRVFFLNVYFHFFFFVFCPTHALCLIFAHSRVKKIEGNGLQTAALSAKLVELATLLAARDAKLAELNDFIRDRYVLFHAPQCALVCGTNQWDGCTPYYCRGMRSSRNTLCKYSMYVFIYIDSVHLWSTFLDISVLLLTQGN